MRSLHIPSVRSVRRSGMLASLLLLVGIIPGLAACGGSISSASNECALQSALRYCVTDPQPTDLRTPGVIAVSIGGRTGKSVKDVTNEDVRIPANAILSSSKLGLREYTKGECPAYGDTQGVCSSFIPFSSNGVRYGVAFFQLEKNGVEDADDGDLKRATDLLTQAAVKGDGVAVRGHSDVSIQGASPNLVVVEGSQGTGHGGGSPDGPPTQTTNAKAKTIPPPSDLGACERRPPRHTGATIYVLDTGVPGMLKDSQQAGTWPIAACLCPSWSNCQNQPLVTDLANGAPALAMGGFIDGQERFLYTSKYGHASWLQYHGLAVSELIHYRVPDAQIVLVPVLNQYGIGTLQTLLTGLHNVQTDAATNHLDPSSVLVNMSLSVEPPTRCIMDIWQHGWERGKSTNDGTAIDPGMCASSPEDDVGKVVKMRQNHSRLIRPLSDFVQSMTDDGFTLVAAVGNDSTTSGRQPQYGADFPAVLCGVISVAATTEPTGTSAWRTGDGVTLLNTSNGPYFSPNGSTTSPDPCLNGDASQKQPTGKSGDARVAYALGRDVCSIDMETPNGMGLWSGSSFAAALTSGNLARIMVEQGGGVPGASPYARVQEFREDQPCG